MVAVPELMDFTVLPAKITSRAWVDDGFRDRLLEDATRVLREEMDLWPEGIEFVVYENTTVQRHLVLPERKTHTLDWDRAKLLEVVERETGADTSVGIWPPPAMIVEAWISASFREALLADPAHELSTAGYALPEERLVVLPNTRNRRFLALPQSPVDATALDADRLRKVLEESFGQDSTKCCASGTCD